MLRIADIFWSPQGEGLCAGTPAVFIRLSGCSLRCPYCDTRDAWSGGRRMSVAKIMAAVAALKRTAPESRLVVTGGEPLEQDLTELLARCREKYFVAVETNGLHFQDLCCDWWTVSPKDVAGYRVHPRLWELAAEIKLLATPALDVGVLQRIRRQTPAAIVLQPESGRPGKYRHAFELFRAGQGAGIADLRLGVQLHKIFHLP
jgi:organic radical activating enzyme